MLDLKYVASNFDSVVARLKTRGGGLDLGPFQRLFLERRELNLALEALQHKRNLANEEMKKKAKEDPGAIDALRGDLRLASSEIKDKEGKLKLIDEELEKINLLIPNVPHESVPVGASEADNRVERTWGEKPTFLFAPKQHFEVGERLGMMDFERATKVAGPRFVFLKAALAQLDRALVSFMISQHAAKGYVELQPPYLVNRGAMMGTGQLPKFEDDAFKTATVPEFFLIPTAEVPVTNYHQDEILEGEKLPIKYCAFSPCFRAEAGAAGKDTRGMIRQHQFHKVELVKFAEPSTSIAELDSLVDDACDILRKLGLHYRVVTLCTADMGFGSQKTLDLEVWLPGQNAYREISSCSNFGDFQARRAKIRYRKGPGEKPQMVHTLNGSGLAIGRTMVALLENYQREDGTVSIPEALQPFMGGMRELRPL